MSRFSSQKVDFVCGRLAAEFPGEDLGKLRAITDAALRQSVIFDSGSRTDSADGETASRRTNDAEERIKAKRDAAMDDIRNMHRKSSKSAPERTPSRDAKAEMEDSIRNAYKGGR